MCGRYFIDPEPDEALLPVLRALEARGSRGLKIRGEVLPCDLAPVLAGNRARQIRPFAMRWGYRLADGRPLINARAESAREKPLFADGMLQRRCLIPASHYFEWQRLHDGGRKKFAIRPTGMCALYLAGIYRHEVGGPRFVVLTRPAAPEIAFIHDRMPLILSPERAYAWLSPSFDPDVLLRSAPQEMQWASED